MTDKCFMIQPFDGGKFDKRFDEVFKPAVMAAGLDPYRVDRDPGVSIPIAEIENGIRQSAICFADVTLDNPNVWFELGYAIAVGKDICIVSSEERQTKYPFDIQHRRIIGYKVESPSDYLALGKQVEERIKALLKQQQGRATITSVASVNQGRASEFQPFEIACLAALGMGSGSATEDSWLSVYYLKNEMEKLGFNSLATNVALANLAEIEFVRMHQFDGQDEPYTACQLLPRGWGWLSANISSLNTRVQPKRTAKVSTNPFDKPVDDEIPF